MKIIILLALTAIFFVGKVNAAEIATVHYLDDIRKPTFTDIQNLAGSQGLKVNGYNNARNDNVLSQLASSRIFVMHLHGDPGRQLMADNTYLSGTNGNNYTIKAISSLSQWNSLSKVKMAIYYGCSTGVNTSSYGDIVQATVGKAAQAAVAWKVTTYVSEVNEWNKLFFEKAKTDNIVESYRHADYWLRNNMGSVAGDRMQLNRNEGGSLYGRIY